MSNIKFNIHNVVDTETKVKARVHYSYGNRTDGREAVTIYARDYGRDLHKLFENAKNESDSMTDYFETSRVVIFADDPLFPAALHAYNRAEAKDAERIAKRKAKRGY